MCFTEVEKVNAEKRIVSTSARPTQWLKFNGGIMSYTFNGEVCAFGSNGV